MKNILFVILLFTCTVAQAQVKVPAEVAQRLQGDRSFTSYAREMMQYVKTNQLNFADGTPQKRYFEKQEKYLARQLWYLEGRQDANGDIANYSQKTFDAINKYSPPPQTGEQNLVANGYWTSVGPQNMVTSTTSKHTGIGRVDRIAFHPTNANIIFAGTPAGGVFKSTNGGTSWFNLNSYMPSLGVSGIVVSWANPDVIYVLTGDGDSNIGDGGFVQGFDYIRPSIGVLKSIDGGVTWNKTGAFGIIGFYTGYKLVQSPTNSNVLIAATSAGLYRTANGGVTWTLVSGNTSRYYDIEWKPGSSTTVYAATASSFYISTDGGANFTYSNSNFDINFTPCLRIAIAVTPANSSYVFVFASNGDGQNKGVYRSTNSGASFSRRNNDGTIATTDVPQYMHGIAVASDNVNIVITGELELYRSTNGGTDFSLANQRGDATLSNYAHDDVHEIIYNPLDDNLYIGCDGGVYKSTDDGVSYTALYVGLNATQYYHFDISDANDNYMFGGAQDNGGHYRAGNTTIFYNTIKGDGYFPAMYNGSTSQLYLSVNKKLYLSNADLTSWGSALTGLDENWYKTVAISPSNNNIAFSSSSVVYKTINGGTTWTNKGANGRWAMITCPSNSNRIYAAGGDSWNDGGNQSGKKMYRSDDQGDNWTEIQDNTGFAATITKITSIGVDPGNSLRVWATLGGFTDGQKVYYSNNGGDTWQNITGSLPNLPVNCLVIDANLDAYIGTDVGVFYKSFTMSDWQPFYNYLPRVPVTQLHIRNGKIYASTFGRGIWKSDTHGDCLPNLNIVGNITGVKFYEANVITSTATVAGGDGSDLQLRASNYVTLSEGFAADGSTGAIFRAWIAPCNSGANLSNLLPEINKWQAGTNTNHLVTEIAKDKATFKVDMLFDAKASIVACDEKGQLKEVFLDNVMLTKGDNKISIKGTADWANRKIVLIVDGQVMGVR